MKNVNIKKLKELREEILDYAKLEKDFNGYGAEEIPQASINNAIKFLDNLSLDCKALYSFPTGRASVQIDISLTDDIFAELEFVGPSPHHDSTLDRVNIFVIRKDPGPHDFILFEGHVSLDLLLKMKEIFFSSNKIIADGRTYTPEDICEMRSLLDGAYETVALEGCRSPHPSQKAWADNWRLRARKFGASFE